MPKALHSIFQLNPVESAALNQNFAVAFDNTGHVGGGIGVGSALWGLDQPQLRIDFGIAQSM